jgi:hypothetical protein
MVVEPGCTVDKVMPVLKQHVQGVEFHRSHGREMAFTIPLSEVSNFSGY